MMRKQRSSSGKKCASRDPERENTRHQNRDVGPSSPHSQPHVSFTQPGCLPRNLMCDLHKDLSECKGREDLMFNPGPRSENVQHDPRAIDDDRKDHNKG